MIKLLIAYANICWNVCESIFDKIILSNGVDGEMKGTWEPVIRVEDMYHRE
jgi:hypothetical protein